MEADEIEHAARGGQVAILMDYAREAAVGVAAIQKRLAQLETD
jgi:hypothetical protein